MVELGYKDPKKYEAVAVEFWNNGEGKIYYSQYMDRFYRYNTKTHIFVSVSSNGYIKTFFKLSPKLFERKRIQERLYEC